MVCQHNCQLLLLLQRIQEKDVEFESTKKNHIKALEQIQFAIEEESKSKAESIRKVIKNRANSE